MVNPKPAKGEGKWEGGEREKRRSERGGEREEGGEGERERETESVSARKLASKPERQTGEGPGRDPERQKKKPSSVRAQPPTCFSSFILLFSSLRGSDCGAW